MAKELGRMPPPFGRRGTGNIVNTLWWGAGSGRKRNSEGAGQH